MVAAIHAGIFALTQSTDTSSNSAFSYNSSRSVSLESFALRMYEKLFFFTAAVSVVIEGSVEFRAKHSYLGFLAKHGLKTRHYFCYRQLLLLTKAMAYAAASFSVFCLLESYCKPQLQLYPSDE
jgi:hypothetical protein